MRSHVSANGTWGARSSRGCDARGQRQRFYRLARTLQPNDRLPAMGGQLDISQHCPTPRPRLPSRARLLLNMPCHVEYQRISEARIALAVVAGATPVAIDARHQDVDSDFP